MRGLPGAARHGKLVALPPSLPFPTTAAVVSHPPTRPQALPLVIRFGPPAAMKALQKAFAGTSPRLVAIVKVGGTGLQ